MLVYVLCLLLPGLSMCAPTELQLRKSIAYKNCGPGEIKDVSLAPCTEEPCTFNKGVNVTVGIDFVSSGSASSVHAKVFGVVAGVPVPFAIPKSDGCSGCNLKCPLQSGPHSYTNELPVLSNYPDIRVVVKWELVDENNKQLVCFEFPIAIVG